MWQITRASLFTHSRILLQCRRRRGNAREVPRRRRKGEKNATVSTAGVYRMLLFRPAFVFVQFVFSSVLFFTDFSRTVLLLLTGAAHRIVRNARVHPITIIIIIIIVFAVRKIIINRIVRIEDYNTPTVLKPPRNTIYALSGRSQRGIDLSPSSSSARSRVP